MRRLIFQLYILFLFICCICAQEKEPFFPSNEYYYNIDGVGVVGYAGVLGSNTNAAIHISGKIWRDNNLISPAKYVFAQWASSCVSYNPGSGISGDGTDYEASEWMKPEKALGMATSGDTSDAVVLGDGGDITMTFDKPICDGESYDFVIYENALNDTFLEFAFVEVSSDGIHFVRFPNFYLGDKPVGSDSGSGGGVNDATKVYNLGSKYRIGYGNGYDIAELKQVFEYVSKHYDVSADKVDSSCIFTLEYIKSFLENYKYLNLRNVKYVKLIDIIGDGNTLDSSGTRIYDAYPTHGTSGFELCGIGVINVLKYPTTYAEWASQNLAAFSAADSLPEAVPFKDGITNLEKYVFGLPADSSATYSRTGYFNLSKTTNSYDLSYRMRSTITDVVVSVEWSTDLITWQSEGIGEEIISDDGEYKIVKCSKVYGVGNIFFRIKVKN